MHKLKNDPPEKGNKVQVSFKKKPRSLNKDSWVANRKVTDQAPKKRLTIDIPEAVHKRFKAKACIESRLMNEIVLELIEGYLGNSK